MWIQSTTTIGFLFHQKEGIVSFMFKVHFPYLSILCAGDSKTYLLQQKQKLFGNCFTFLGSLFKHMNLGQPIRSTRLSLSPGRWLCKEPDMEEPSATLVVCCRISLSRAVRLWVLGAPLVLTSRRTWEEWVSSWP